MPKLKPSQLLPLLVLLSACEGNPDRGSEAAEGGSTPSGVILVSAAASLTDAFADMKRDFEDRHPGVDVRLNLAGSATLATQIIEGVPADVFAPADIATMDRVARAGETLDEPRLFARNLLRIAVPPGNPAKVQGLADFARDEIHLGLCAASVPCGHLARRALARAGVTPAHDTDEPDVRALVTKVELGELDAAITYVTDVTEAGASVEGIAIPDDANVSAAYPIAVLAGSSNPPAARAFVAFVLSPDGQRIMTRHGFASP